MFERERIKVMLCCNNPKNGVFAHCLSALEIGPNMTFDSTRWLERQQPRMRWLMLEDGGTYGIAIRRSEIRLGKIV